MQKLVLNPTYSRLFDFPVIVTKHPKGFFEKVFENQIRILFFTFTKESFILCLAPLPQIYLQAAKGSQNVLLAVTEDTIKNFLTKSLLQ